MVDPLQGWDLKDEGAHVVVEVKQSRAIDVQDGVERMPAPGWESYEDENGKYWCGHEDMDQ